MISKRRPVLFLSSLLGNGGMSRRIRRALQECDIEWDIDVVVEPEYFRSVPRRHRVWGDTRFVMTAGTKALRDARLSHDATVVVNGWELGLVAMKDPRVGKVILAMDTLPTTNLLRQAGLLRGGGARALLRRTSSLAHVRNLRQLRGKVSGLLPMSNLVSSEARRVFTPSADIPIEITWSPQEFISPTARKLGDPNTFRVIFVANHLELKGFHTFVDGVIAARDAIPLEAAVITNAADAVARLNGANVEVISGLQSPSDVHQEFRRSDLSVLPTERDQLPNVIAESLAAGTPVIATAVGAIPELVIPGRTGWLLPAGANGSLVAQAILEAAQQPLPQELRESALQFAAEKLAWPVFTSKIEGVVRHAMEL